MDLSKKREGPLEIEEGLTGIASKYNGEDDGFDGKF